MLGIFRECLIYNVIETSSRWLLARDGQGGGSPSRDRCRPFSTKTLCSWGGPQKGGEGFVLKLSLNIQFSVIQISLYICMQVYRSNSIVL